MLIIEVWFFVIAGQFVQQGLEYRIVFVMDSNEGITPHRRAAFEKDMEKERRLFYVVMTRPRSFCICFRKEAVWKEGGEKPLCGGIFGRVVISGEV